MSFATAAARVETQEAPISALQEQILQVPEEFDLALLGGRGRGATHAELLLIIRHLHQYGDRASVLYLRRTYPALTEFVQFAERMLRDAFGPTVHYVENRHLFRLPHGTFEVGQLRDAGDYEKYQGRSFTLLIVGEATQWPTLTAVDLVRSNLRAPKGIPTRTVFDANPGGPGHQVVAKRFIKGREPGVPFTDEATGRQVVRIAGTYRDNPFIDRDAYAQQLAGSAADDPELVRAWLDGDWNISRGAFFADAIDEDRNLIDWPEPEGDRPHPGFEFYLAHDFGMAAPSVTYIVARSRGANGPDGRYYRPGSIILADEFASNVPGDLNTGMRYSVSRLADEIKELAARWKIKPDGCADDAIFNSDGREAGSVQGEFARYGVHFQRAGKGSRLAGWTRLRRMLSNAGAPDEPGLYLSKRCRYFWETAPFVERDPRRPEDVDTRSSDHALDTARYAVVWERPRGYVLYLR